MGKEKEKEEWQVLEGKKTDESLCECIEKKNGSLQKLFFFCRTELQLASNSSVSNSRPR